MSGGRSCGGVTFRGITLPTTVAAFTPRGAVSAAERTAGARPLGLEMLGAGPLTKVLTGGFSVGLGAATGALRAAALPWPTCGVGLRIATFSAGVFAAEIFAAGVFAAGAFTAGAFFAAGAFTAGAFFAATFAAGAGGRLARGASARAVLRLDFAAAVPRPGVLLAGFCSPTCLRAADPVLPALEAAFPPPDARDVDLGAAFFAMIPPKNSKQHVRTSTRTRTRRPALGHLVEPMMRHACVRKALVRETEHKFGNFVRGV
ncbi:MAG: hypothetical protein FJX78_03285 [Armatimonadetes bacterium]|nr:hypothetical protein [Armatimonadota bacterium]